MRNILKGDYCWKHDWGEKKPQKTNQQTNLARHGARCGCAERETGYRSGAVQTGASFSPDMTSPPLSFLVEVSGRQRGEVTDGKACLGGEAQRFPDWRYRKQFIVLFPLLHSVLLTRSIGRELRKAGFGSRFRTSEGNQSNRKSSGSSN